MEEPVSESIWVEGPEFGGDRLHLKHWYKKDASRPALLLHGAIENGRIFYSESAKGFAPFLASWGFHAYAADLRGRGLSGAPISRVSRYGQIDAIRDEIPALAQAVSARHGHIPVDWVAHSWGGVLMLSALARNPRLLPLVRSLVFFATKRSIRIWNPERLLKIDLFWNRLARMAAWKWGYVPARELRWGSDNETVSSHRDSTRWVRAGAPWVDPRDGFDYGSAIRGLKLPPSLWLTGSGDRCLGHRKDVESFRRESGVISDPRSVFWTVGKGTGAARDYGHVDLLTDPEAPRDHFPKIVQWMLGV